MERLSALEKEFDARVKAALLECHQLGYHPTDLEGMLRASSASRLAERLVSESKIHSGLKKLAALTRLDLSVESIMLEPQFESLFRKPFRDAAQFRLEDVQRKELLAK